MRYVGTNDISIGNISKQCVHIDLVTLIFILFIIKTSLFPGRYRYR